MSTETDALLNHPDVDALIKMILRSRRLPAVHMEDAIQQVKIKAFESTIGNHPTTIDGWQKVCRPISNSVAVDAYRSARTEGKTIVDRTDEPDAAPAASRHDSEHPIDVQRKLMIVDELHQERKIDPRTPAILDALQAGRKGPEIAAELGVTHQWLRTYLMNLRKTVKQEFVVRGVVAAMVIGAIVYIARLRAFDPTPVAHVPDRPSVSPVESAPPTISDDELARAKQDRDNAAALIFKAEVAFKKEEWDDCMNKLQDAKKLDGQSVPDDSSLNAECRSNKEREADAKTRPHKKRR